MLELQKIKALISLLDDPDPQVWEPAMIELSNADIQISNTLKELLESGLESTEQHERLEACIDRKSVV